MSGRWSARANGCRTTATEPAAFPPGRRSAVPHGAWARCGHGLRSYRPPRCTSPWEPGGEGWPTARYLDLRVLGTFAATVDGRVTDALESDTVRALLCCLAMERDRAHRREALAALLWSAAAPHAAQASLRNAPRDLGTVLGDRPTGSPLVLADRPTARLTPDAEIATDVEAFADLITATRGHAHRRLHLCASCRERLERAVALYRGPLLADLTLRDSPDFDAWAATRRGALHDMALQALAAPWGRGARPRAHGTRRAATPGKRSASSPGGRRRTDA